MHCSSEITNNLTGRNTFFAHSIMCSVPYASELFCTMVHTCAVCTCRCGGTGPADPATAGPKLNRNPQFKIFHCCLDTLIVLINNKSMIKTTVYVKQLLYYNNNNTKNIYWLFFK